MTTHDATRDRDRLLDTLVADLVDAAPRAVEVLVAHGFTPLANPAVRAVMARRVTLRQAVALRRLPAQHAAALLDALTELFIGRETRGPA